MEVAIHVPCQGKTFSTNGKHSKQHAKQSSCYNKMVWIRFEVTSTKLLQLPISFFSHESSESGNGYCQAGPSNRHILPREERNKGGNNSGSNEKDSKETNDSGDSAGDNGELGSHRD